MADSIVPHGQDDLFFQLDLKFLVFEDAALFASPRKREACASSRSYAGADKGSRAGIGDAAYNGPHRCSAHDAEHAWQRRRTCHLVIYQTTVDRPFWHAVEFDRLKSKLKFAILHAAACMRGVG